MKPVDAPTLWAQADERDERRAHLLRSVQARIKYWEGRNPELEAKFRHAEAVMLAGGECPMRPASLLTIMEAITSVGLLIGTAVGPNRPEKRSPVEIVARFVGEDIPVDPLVRAASHTRHGEIRRMLQTALQDAGVDTTRTAQHQFRESGMT